VPRPDDTDDVIVRDVRTSIAAAGARVVRVVADAVVAQLVANAIVAGAKAMTAEHELDRIGRECRRLGANAPTR
jgi:hypothetical protein